MAETKPLWSTEDQATRLVELTSDEPDVKEAPLRRDVRSLGRLLGEVLKEQAGETLFNAVEEIRQLAIECRELEHDPPQDLRDAREHELTERVALIARRATSVGWAVKRNNFDLPQPLDQLFLSTNK